MILRKYLVERGDMPKTVLVNGCFLLQQISGVQRYASELLSALVRIRQDRYNWLLAVPGRRRQLVQEIGGMDVYFDNSVLHPAIWTQASFPLLGGRLGADFLWSPANIGPLLHSKPQVITVFDGSLYHNRKWFDWKFSAYYKTVFAGYKYSANRIITCSDFSKGEIVKYLCVPPAKVDVVPAAISSSFCRVNEKSVLDGRYVLSLGSRDPRKNIRSVIRAWRRVPADIKNGLRLVIAGGGNTNFAVESLGRATDDVVFLGYVPDKDLPALYSNAHCFVYPSFYEGFGLPPLEAMACGCPVITSDVASLPEVCGDAAYYVDPYSIDSIVHGFREVVRNEQLRGRLVENGFENGKRFNWDRSAAEMLRALDKIN
ncbi:MAG: group 1 glycosyl transferase [Elusimicrobia bacterium]|nr:MAG: group 1 glycosyl transferase [Elusimicrobiota bacterium]